jgi:hypothetical protein
VASQSPTIDKIDNANDKIAARNDNNAGNFAARFDKRHPTEREMDGIALGRARRSLAQP